MQIKNYSLVEKLEKSGFTDKEAKIYVALLELGGAYPSKVASYTSLNRSTVYHTLSNLSIKGLVSEIEKSKKYFYSIEKPIKLVRFGEKSISAAEDKLESIKFVLPEIEGIFEALNNHPKVAYYENVDGIQSIYEDMISVGNKYEMLAWSNAAELENILDKKFFEHFRKIKNLKGITTRGIIPDTEADRAYNERFFAMYKKNVIPKMKYVKKESFPFKGEITVYANNKVAIINLNKEYLTGIIIEDETIYKMMKLIFELSWSSNLLKD